MRKMYLLIILPLVVRLIYLLEAVKNPFFNFPIVDCATYDHWAVAIVSGNVIGDKIFWQPPLYPYFMAAIYAIFGQSYIILRVIQILIGSISCVLVFQIGKKIFDQRIAFIAFMIMSFYGPLIHFDTELLPSTLLIFLMLVVLYLITEKPERILLPSIITGLAAITHGIGLIFAIGYLTWILFRIYRQFFVALLGILIPISVVAVRNVAVGNDLVLISYNGGVNFYIGNNPNYEYTTHIRPGIDWQQLVNEPVKMGYRKPSSRARYYYNKAFRYIAGHPFEYLELLARKVLLFLSGNEIMRNQSIYPFRNYSVLLSVLLFKFIIGFPFGVLLPLSGVGIYCALKKKRRISILLFFLAAVFITSIGFFVVSRYRLPAVPVLTIFTAFGFCEILRVKKNIYAWIIMLVLFLIANFRIGSMASIFNYDAYYNLAAVEHKKGKIHDAENHYLIALSLKPDLLDAQNNLAAIYNETNRPLEALRQLAEILKRNPSNSHALNNLGNTYRILGILSLAERKYQLALLADTTNRGARSNLLLIKEFAQAGYKKTPLVDSVVLLLKDLAAYYSNNNLPGSAVATTVDLLTLRPEDPLLHNNLGTLYYQVGKVDKAREELRLAIKLEPKYIPALLNLARIEFKTGNRDRALSLYKRVLVIDPDNKEAKDKITIFRWIL